MSTSYPQGVHSENAGYPHFKKVEKMLAFSPILPYNRAKQVKKGLFFPFRRAGKGVIHISTQPITIIII